MRLARCQAAPSGEFRSPATSPGSRAGRLPLVLLDHVRDSTPEINWFAGMISDTHGRSLAVHGGARTRASRRRRDRRRAALGRFPIRRGDSRDGKNAPAGRGIDGVPVTADDAALWTRWRCRSMRPPHELRATLRIWSAVSPPFATAAIAATKPGSRRVEPGSAQAGAGVRLTAAPEHPTLRPALKKQPSVRAGLSAGRESEPPRQTTAPR